MRTSVLDTAGLRRSSPESSRTFGRYALRRKPIKRVREGAIALLPWLGAEEEDRDHASLSTGAASVLRQNLYASPHTPWNRTLWPWVRGVKAAVLLVPLAVGCAAAPPAAPMPVCPTQALAPIPAPPPPPPPRESRRSSVPPASGVTIGDHEL
jgi:hypothetical protein